jgi:glycosyltransferase involved in cell wall biosynthesis
VFVCEHQRDHWMEKYPEFRPLATVVHNGVDPAHFQRADFEDAARNLRRELGIRQNAFVFSCLAAFRREKGHELLIKAVAQTPPGTFLILAGDGERRPDIEAAVYRSGLNERVRFLGNVADVRPVIVASDATVLASTAVETFSMAMLESMALGVPMIAPRIGGLAEAIIPGETGLLFPVGDVARLAEGMRMMISERDRTQDMGRQANAKVFRNFTSDLMIRKSERVLIEVLEGEAI